MSDLRGYRLLVCGGRDFTDALLMAINLKAFNEQHGISFLIHGDARGADQYAGAWAEDHNIPVQKFPADWNAHGRAAGPIRNKKMLDDGKPQIVMAFPGGDGTAHMIRLAKSRKIQVIEIGKAP